MLINKFKRLSSDKFIQNIGWLGGAEVVQRIFRLATTVTLARVFTSHDYGMVSAIYTTFDLIQTLSLRAGIGAKIIQADKQDLKVICDTSYWLNWILCVSLFVIQCLIAYPIAMFYGDVGLVFPICVLSLINLILPFYLVQSALIERENRLKIKALCYLTQAILSNIIILVLAILGMGVWAVVLSMVISYPVWIIITHLNHSWRPNKSFTLEKWREVTSFGSKRLGVELLDRLRMNLDYLLVGKFLGIDALGIYFFAFNAGLGISQSVINALTSAWYPHFCEVKTSLKELRKRYFQSFKTIATLVVPLVALQSLLAPFYVPIIFGEKWVSGIPILILICLCAIPISFARSNSQLLQAVDKTNIDIYWNIIFTFIFSTSLILVVKGGIFWVACAVLISQLVLTPIFITFIIKRILYKKITA